MSNNQQRLYNGYCLLFFMKGGEYVTVSFVELPLGIVGFGNEESLLLNNKILERSMAIARINGKVLSQMPDKGTDNRDNRRLQVQLIDISAILSR